MVRFLLNIYTLVLIVDVILSYLPEYRNHPFVRGIRRASEFTCGPIRRLLGQLFPQIPQNFDFSPFVVILLIWILQISW